MLCGSAADVLEDLTGAALERTLAVARIERHALGKRGLHRIRQLPLRVFGDGDQHIAELKIAVIALDGLIDERPCFLGSRLGGRSDFAEEPQCGKTDRTALLVEQRGLGTCDRLIACTGILVDKLRQSIEAFPAGACFGPVQRIDKLTFEGNEQIRMLFRDFAEDRRGILACSI